MRRITESIDFIDLFGGIGGFRHGLEAASDKFNCVGYYDNDKYAVKSYNAIFGENHEPTDVSKLDAEEIPDHNVLCAGFPCQSFSIAGNREGFEDTRGTLFFEIARIARAKKPEVLLLENVKGLLSHDYGRTFGTILQALDELGYYVEWQVLNSKHWGVPQNRERVFIIGHLGGEPQRKVFPVGREDAEDSEEDGGENLDTVHPNRPELGQADRVYSKDGLLPALNGGWTPQIQVEENEINMIGNVNPSGRGMNGKVYYAGDEAVLPTVSTNKGEGHKIVQQNQRQEVVSKEGSGAVHESMSSRQAPKVIDWHGHEHKPAKQMNISPTLRSESHGHQPKILKNHRNREIRDHGQISPTINKIQGGGQKPMVINHQMRPEDRPSIQEGQSGGSGILSNSEYSYSLTSSPHFVKPTLTPERVEKRQNGRRMKESDDPMFTLTGQDIHGVTEWKPLQRKRTEEAKEIRREYRQKYGEDYSPMSEYKFGIKDEEDVFHTVTAQPEKSHKLKKGVRIRKLTPLECWRLQGFPDSSFEAAEKVNSDTQLYKQAGNAVTVNVIKALGEELEVYFGETDNG